MPNNHEGENMIFRIRILTLALAVTAGLGFLMPACHDVLAGSTKKQSQTQSQNQIQNQSSTKIPGQNCEQFKRTSQEYKSCVAAASKQFKTTNQNSTKVPGQNCEQFKHTSQDYKSCVAAASKQFIKTQSP
jgi:hypothetical protein